MFQYYLIHYFNFKNAGGFMLVSLLCLIAVLAIVILTAKLQKTLQTQHTGSDTKADSKAKPYT